MNARLRAVEDKPIAYTGDRHEPPRVFLISRVRRREPEKVLLELLSRVPECAGGQRSTIDAIF